MACQVYILANPTHTALFTGVTGNLRRRVWERKTHADLDGYTARYDVTELVYFETFSDTQRAMAREAEIKGWSREAVVRLVEGRNPRWADLYETLG